MPVDVLVFVVEEPEVPVADAVLPDCVSVGSLVLADVMPETATLPGLLAFAILNPPCAGSVDQAFPDDVGNDGRSCHDDGRHRFSKLCITAESYDQFRDKRRHGQPELTAGQFANNIF